MKTEHYNTIETSRKKLTDRIQKSVLLLLMVLLAVSFGLYKLIEHGFDARHTRQGVLLELQNRVKSVESHWLEWLLLESGTPTQIENKVLSTPKSLLSSLSSEYTYIDSQLGSYHKLYHLPESVSVKSSLEVLKTLSMDLGNSYTLSAADKALILTSLRQTKSLYTELVKMEVGLDYEHHQFLVRYSAWVPFFVMAMVGLIIVFLSTLLTRQIQSGFHYLHRILEHHKYRGMAFEPPRHTQDEFSDVGHLLDLELSSKNYDIAHLEKQLNLVGQALSLVDHPFVVVNSDGDIEWVSQGFESLWERHSQEFDSLLGIDVGLDSPIGERLSESVLLSDSDIKLTLGGDVYSLVVHPLESSSEYQEGLQALVKIVLKSDATELEILRNSLQLMKQDVWNLPVRVLRKESVYREFSLALESIRLQVMSLLEEAENYSQNTNMYGKITKLQQIKSLFQSTIKNNKLDEMKLVSVSQNVDNEGLVEGLENVSLLSEKVRDSFLVGYESTLQRLELVKKDISSDVMLLEEVSRCLNEVRAGVLSSLAQAQGEDDDIRRRFSIDLNHDIDSVQKQISQMQQTAVSTLTLLEADHGNGLARLERAQASIDDMIEQVENLYKRTPPVAKDSEQEPVKLILKPQQDGWEEF